MMEHLINLLEIHGNEIKIILLCKLLLFYIFHKSLIYLFSEQPQKNV